MAMAQSASDELPKEERLKMNEMVKLLSNWDGRFNETSISATVYAFTTLRLYESWLTKLLPESDLKNRMLLLGGYGFVDYFQLLINQIEQDDGIETSYLTGVCKSQIY